MTTDEAKAKPKLKKLVLIGTSGSMDYLRDATPDQYRPTRHDRRFWPVAASNDARDPDDRSDDDQVCDGLHDETAPAYHLCTRCFPDLVDRYLRDRYLRGDLAEPQDDEYDESRRDDVREME